mmetsp:Transcript_67984/g.134760  ORF Transcript_67984/g.134760 Transcript_67984/m.134760 type:complete len:315 (+) Transcript_67984:358-1302(+)
MDGLSSSSLASRVPRIVVLRSLCKIRVVHSLAMTDRRSFAADRSRWEFSSCTASSIERRVRDPSTEFDMEVWPIEERCSDVGELLLLSIAVHDGPREGPTLLLGSWEMVDSSLRLGRWPRCRGAAMLSRTPLGAPTLLRPTCPVKRWAPSRLASCSLRLSATHCCTRLATCINGFTCSRSRAASAHARTTSASIRRSRCESSSTFSALWKPAAALFSLSAILVASWCRSSTECRWSSSALSDLTVMLNSFWTAAHTMCASRSAMIESSYLSCAPLITRISLRLLAATTKGETCHLASGSDNPTTAPCRSRMRFF